MKKIVELEKFATTHELDTAVSLSGLRFRANFYKTIKGPACVCRRVESKIPEKCKGKDTCHDFRLCKLCLPYWKKFNKLNSDAVKEENVDDEESEEKAGIDAEYPGYEEAYKVSKEEEEASGYDSNEDSNEDKHVKMTADTKNKKDNIKSTAKKPCSCGRLIKKG